MNAFAVWEQAVQRLNKALAVALKVAFLVFASHLSSGITTEGKSEFRGVSNQEIESNIHIA
jgi:hypothetical protein